MLDTETKRRIDSCRDILVGKIPDPKSQVEQITIALIYKFMDDMDKESIYMGGKASFFTGEFERYSWTSIFDPRIGGHELLNLYGEAITKMNQNPNIPQLFRDIFKNAFLPYRDPETLKSFLKKINGFTYDHSEKLGDAFEYLLSVLSSQGDAGQFRTPRHIIDFMVEVVEPRLNDTILDPACGTAGFLISAYKHIKKANPKLTAAQKKRLLDNVTGYDISPDMVRLSLVNMYLHGFASPAIYEYDTLTSETRWGDSFDCIMANPPFMSPKGGIRPHNRFSITAKRSEVLFVDYIAEHLNASGRAAVIVPEGIIFQSQNAYKQLRKMLLEKYLWAVVSLPAGIFNPYSGVKTSILFMDKSLAKRIDRILFVKIENDGFDLGAQRRAIDKNDLTAALKFLDIYKSKIEDYKEMIEEADFAHAVTKEEIAKSGDYSLTGDRYRIFEHPSQSEWPMVELASLVDIRTGKKDVNEGNVNGSYPFFTCAKEHTFSDVYSFDTEALLIAGNGDVGSVKYYKGKFEAYQRTYVLSQFVNIEPRLLYYFLNNRLKETVSKQKLGNTMPYIKLGMLSTFKIPLPPLDVQEKIVAEIEGYQRIIDAARQIVENYKPTIKIDPAWPIQKIESADFQIIDGDRGVNYPKAHDFSAEGYCLFLNTKNVTKAGFNFDNVAFITKHKDEALRKGKLKRNDVILTTRGTIGNVAFYDDTVPYEHIRINSGMLIIRPNANSFVPKYLYHLFNCTNITTQFERILSGSAQPQLPIRNLISVEIPVPPLAQQKQIVDRIEEEQKAVDANKRLIQIFEAKIKDTIAEVWSPKAPITENPR